MMLNCCARKLPSESKAQSKDESTRTRLPWHTEPEKFNREAIIVPKFENKALQPKKPLEAEAAQKSKPQISGLDKTESALQDATSNIAKAKKSVMDAKMEMENLRRRQTDLTKSLVEKEKQTSSQGGDLMKNFFDTSKLASVLIMKVPSHFLS
jgi:hypothetical protein